MKPFVRQNQLNRRTGYLFILFALFSFSALAQKKPLSTAKLNKCLPLFDALNTGHLSLNPRKYAPQIKVAQQDLEGLQYMGVTVWKPKEITDFQRKLVRYHQVDKYAQRIPEYDKLQKLGPSKVNIDELFFSQLGCQNASEGGFTVINNAKAFRDGTLKVDDLPALRVWRDSETQKIWTLDHRRLAAMKLSGRIKEAKVEFVSEEIVKQQRFKFDTQTNGEVIFVRVEKPGEEPLAIVVGNHLSETLPNKAGVATNSFSTNEHARQKVYQQLLQKFDVKDRDQWLSSRGEGRMFMLRQYAQDIAESLASLDAKMNPDIVKIYGPYGKVSTRGKGEASVLAKLMRKDFEAFQKGQDGITSLKGAINSLGDAIGSRVILNSKADGTINPSDVQAIVNKIEADIKGGLRVTEVMNYRARETGIPYLSDKQMKQIIDADREYRLKMTELKKTKPDTKVPDPIIVKSGPSASFETGYTSFHMNILYPSGVQGELQIKGKLVHEASEIQHLIYDLKAGKVLSTEHKGNQALVKAADEFKHLSDHDKARMMKYVEGQLIFARHKEMGKVKGSAPKLAADLPQSLSFENLKPHLIHD